MPHIDILGSVLEYSLLPAARDTAPTLVFLHEGLGSLAQWRAFPHELALATGCAALVYSRLGYGQSGAPPHRRGSDFMHVEALRVLPALLSKLGVAEPILVGHSDGASIALIYAASGLPLRAVIAEAPHVLVEEITLQGIQAARRAYAAGELAPRLAKFHRDVDATFFSWCDAWLDPAFRAWNIEAFLPQVRCPVLAIQGEQDEYGSMVQLDSIARRVQGPCRQLRLANCRHTPHRERADEVLAAMRDFVLELGDGSYTPGR